MSEMLPAFYLPSDVILLDDDELFLKSVSNLLSYKNKSLSILSYSSVDEARSRIKKQDYFEKIDFSKEILPLREGEKVVNYDLKRIFDLKNEKQFPVSVIIVDYSMPRQNGLDFLKEFKNSPTYKILLTGIAGDDIIIDAFNTGLIDFYVNKANSDLNQILLDVISTGQQEYFARRTSSLLDAISTDEDNNLLKVRDFQEILLQFIKEYHITSYFLIDEMGSYLLESQEKSYIFFITEKHKNSSLIETLEEKFSQLSDDEEFQKLVADMRVGKKILFENSLQDFNVNDFEDIKSFVRKAKCISHKGHEYFFFFEENNFEYKGKFHSFFER